MTSKIAIISAISGVIAGIGSAVIGSWKIALEVLCIGMALDYITGLIVAGVFHKSPKSPGGALESKAALKGLLRKMLVLIMVVLFHQLDRLTGKTFFRDGACWAFFTVEAISIVENVGLIYPLPAFITKGIDWLKRKDEGLAELIKDDKPPDEGAVDEGTDSSTPRADVGVGPYGAHNDRMGKENDDG